ncbi:hypothetical protein ACFL35_05430 [Candidatus Riflebacteria bacterium]
MALILCNECGKEFSEHAPACIHCGCPFEIATKKKPVEAQVESRGVVQEQIQQVEEPVKENEISEPIQTSFPIESNDRKIAYFCLGVILLPIVLLASCSLIFPKSPNRELNRRWTKPGSQSGYPQRNSQGGHWEKPKKSLWKTFTGKPNTIEENIEEFMATRWVKDK